MSSNWEHNKILQFYICRDICYSDADATGTTAAAADTSVGRPTHHARGINVGPAERPANAAGLTAVHPGQHVSGTTHAVQPSRHSAADDHGNATNPSGTYQILQFRLSLKFPNFPRHLYFLRLFQQLSQMAPPGTIISQIQPQQTQAPISQVAANQMQQMQQPVQQSIALSAVPQQVPLPPTMADIKQEAAGGGMVDDHAGTATSTQADGHEEPSKDGVIDSEYLLIIS